MTEIRYFLAVCETLNFHRAAERCHVTQPALTRAVQKLEAELGVSSFWPTSLPHKRRSIAFRAI